MLARAITHALVGLEPRQVEVEAHLSGGTPSLTIVGLADRACQEAKERVRELLAGDSYAGVCPGCRTISHVVGHRPPS